MTVQRFFYGPAHPASLPLRRRGKRMQNGSRLRICYIPRLARISRMESVAPQMTSSLAP